MRCRLRRVVEPAPPLDAAQLRRLFAHGEPQLLQSRLAPPYPLSKSDLLLAWPSSVPPGALGGPVL